MAVGRPENIALLFGILFELGGLVSDRNTGLYSYKEFFKHKSTIFHKDFVHMFNLRIYMHSWAIGTNACTHTHNELTLFYGLLVADIFPVFPH